MEANFPAIMEHVFQVEGGYVNNPSDPGGATNMGITIHTLRNLEMDLDNDGDIDRDDVILVSKEVATDIYRVRYWEPVEGPEMPSGLDLVLMDGGVNSGPRTSVRWVQRALGVVADGILGPQTMGAIRNANKEKLIANSLNERRRSVRSFRNYDVFGKGWENRINAVEHRAQELRKND